MKPISQRIRNFTHVYLCSKKELYRELRAARQYGNEVDGQLSKSEGHARRLAHESSVYYANWRKEQRKNGDLLVEIRSLRNRIAVTENNRNSRPIESIAS